MKPDPALYLLALERLGVTADEAIAFEDSPNGILAAKRAGIYLRRRAESADEGSVVSSWPIDG